jgi:dolichol kinase
MSVTFELGRTGAMWVWFSGCFLLFFHLLLRKTGREGLSASLSAPLAFLLVLPFYRFSLSSYLADTRAFLDLCSAEKYWLFLGVVFLAAEFATYWKLSGRMKGEVYRHLVHALGALLIAYFVWVNVDLAFIFLCFYIAIFSFGTYLRHAPLSGRYIETFQGWLNQWLSAGERTAEESKLFMAAYFGMVGMAIPILLLSKKVALASVLSLALGDPTATMVGLKYGRHRWPHNPGKSLEGSAAMGLVLFLLLLFFASPLVAVAAAVSVVLFESMPLAMSDNLIVPLFAGMILTATGP